MHRRDGPAAVARVERELRRVNAALNDSDLPNFVKALAPPGLREFQKKLEALASGRLPKPKPSGHLQRLAAQHATLLLQEHHVRVTSTRTPLNWC